MRLELINIGDELLIGQTINTNASWIGNLLSERGVRVAKSITIQDEKEDIVSQLTDCLSRADVVLITGGLGPTKDDITKETLCTYFGGELVLHQETLALITAYFEARNRPMLDTNKNQAMIPDVCEVLINHHGTAPGMWFERDGKIVVSLPGVPYEMKPLMQEAVLPRLQERFKFADIFQVSIMTTGIGESFLAEKIKIWEDKLRSDELALAYLPSPGIVRLRVTSYKGEADREKVEDYIHELKELIGDYYYGEENETLALVVSRLLIENKYTIGTVESCTAGMLSGELTKIPGSSAYFEGSILTYSNRLKHDLVEIPFELLETAGAVSQECVELMAVNGRERLSVDFCLATSGIAGPDGGTPEKPVGTVWIALAFDGGVYSKQFSFGGNRERNISMSVLAALNLLRMKLLGKV
jgi:nicotinamide-nucleotide amidase